MPFELPPLPYTLDALEPHISKETLEYHYGKHHQAYVNNLNLGLQDRPDLAHASLEELIQNESGPLFNNAAQVWNHSFYWQCLSPQADLTPQGPLLDALQTQFGSLEGFQEQFLSAAAKNFGSGWTWLIKESDGTLSIESTGNADTPIRNGRHPILTVDVWEHAYYIDTRNSRPAYLNNFWRLINWPFVAERFAS